MTTPRGPIVAALLSALLTTAAAAQEVHVFPDDCMTLAGCIADAAEGDVVRIATSTPIDESIILNRSVTIEAASGVAAALVPGRFLQISHGERDGDYTIRGLRLTNAGIRVTQGSTGSLRVAIEGNVLDDVPGPTAAISVTAFRLIGTAGPIDFAIRDNVIGFGERGMGIASAGILIVPGPYADATGIVAGNRVTALVRDHGGAAIAAVAYERDLTVDVIGNRTTGERYLAGIGLYKTDPDSTLTARVANNVVTGGRNENTLVGIAASVAGGDLVVDVHNNSLARVGEGIALRRAGDGRLDARIGNNVVAHASTAGFLLDDGGMASVVWGRNLVFDFARSHLPARTILDDPRFAGTDDLHLRADSPALDAGDPVADLTADADGNPRALGDAVDLGAYEAPCDERCAPVAPPSACDPAACDDGDPCTTDACDTAGCVHAPRLGLDGARCACERPLPPTCVEPPRALARAIDRACRLLDGDGGKKALRRAARAWQQALRQATSRKLGPACAGPLGAALRDARTRTLDVTR